MTRVIVFYANEIQDEFDINTVGHCLYVYWPKDKAGEPVTGDRIEVVPARAETIAEAVDPSAPTPVKRWTILKTERASRGEFGPSDHILMLVDAESPIPMVLACPDGHAHVDEGPWAKRPHKTHQCQVADCGLEWRPHEYSTVGVAEAHARP